MPVAPERGIACRTIAARELQSGVIISGAGRGLARGTEKKKGCDRRRRAQPFQTTGA
jgi:hypothetical protein